jgi:hypothetical protein
VSALVEVHSHYCVAGVKHSEVYGCVGLSAGIRLNVTGLSSEKLAGSFSRDILYNVYALTAAIIALTGKSLGVFVCENAAHSRHYRLADYILARDELKISALTGKLIGNALSYLRISLSYDFDALHFFHFDFSLSKNSYVESMNVFSEDAAY